MKLHWITSSTLSLIRAVQSCADANLLALTASPDKRFSLKNADANTRFVGEARSISERLISAAVNESMFWDHLTDELLSSGNDAPLTPQLCEVALLRAGLSQLQSDQTAAAIHRSLENSRRLLAIDAPRWIDQLRLRYAPLKQAYEAYGPGLVRSIGQQIWNGSPPKNWWPGRVTVHAVQPLQGGASGRSGFQSCVWIEAVLTDVSPNVPEWLRLVYQLTLLAIDTQTRTHASHSGRVSSPGSGASAGTTIGESKHTVELPWSLGIIPLVLDQASAAGVLPAGPLPIGEAIDMWWCDEDPAQRSTSKSMRYLDPQCTTSEIANRLQIWWRESGSSSQAFPIALKRLTSMLPPTRSEAN